MVAVKPLALPSSPSVSRRMSRARREDTAPEIALRSELHRRGLRFRVHVPLPFDRRRRADIAFPAMRVAVFVDGCFWHSCPEHATWPKANAAFWLNKLEGNKRRDVETNEKLRQLGWKPIRIWEHESPIEAADAVEALVRCRRLETRASAAAIRR